MQNENWIRNRLRGIESQIFLIKILLLIQILISLLIFQIFRDNMGEVGDILKIPLFIGTIIAAIYLVMHLLAYIIAVMPSRKRSIKIDRDLQELIEKAKEEQQEN